MGMDISKIFLDEKIEYFSVIPYSLCTPTRPYLLERDGLVPRSVICFLVPYYTGEGENISAYAVGYDYHGYMDALFSRACSALSDMIPGAKFVGYADKSPIDERSAAAIAGLGVIGRNGLLITEKYSSYVFLGEIITDAEPSELGYIGASEIKYCEGCNKCHSVCPINKEGCECLSALSQKKGELSENEKAILVKYNTVWGCDICQQVCPYTKRAIAAGSIMTPIDYFYESRITGLTPEIIEKMTDDEFSRRAYSWRTRRTVLRNLMLFEDKF